jgi:Fe-S cluster assembly protein SufD
LADLAIRHTTDLRPGIDPAQLLAFSERLGDSALISSRREAARVAYLAAPAPDRARHLWRYTDYAGLLPTGDMLRTTPCALSEPAPMPPAGGLVRMVPGGVPQLALSGEALAAGVEAWPLAAAPPRLQALIGATVSVGHGLFEAMSAAAWSTGLALRLPRSATLAGPLHVQVNAGAGNNLPRILVLAEEGARATIVEEHLGGGPEGATVAVTELLLGPGAQLDHVLIQRWRADARGHLTARARLARDATLRSTLASIGGGLAKLDLGALLDEPGARSELRGVVFGAGTQRLDHHTLHHHGAPHTSSSIDLKVALTGQARSAYTGLIRVDERAAGTEAVQENRNLLLSDDARAETIPELEILTDDVSCSHGATVAPVDPIQRFYLESRGVAPDESLRLIVGGFFEDTLARVPEALSGDLRAELTRRLGSVQGGA